MDLLRLIGTIGFWATTLGAIVFTVLFLTTVRWRSDSLGWLIGLFFLVMSTILGFSSLQIIWPEMPGRFIARGILLPALGAVIWGGVVVFVRSQILPRRKARRGTRESRHRVH